MPVPTLLAVVVLAYWLTIAFGVPMQHRLWGAMYPATERGHLLGVVATGRTAAAAVAALAGGIIADRIGGLGAIAIAGAIGALCALSSTGIRTSIAASAGSYSFRETWSAYQRCRRFAVLRGPRCSMAAVSSQPVRCSRSSRWTGCRCRSRRSAPSASSPPSPRPRPASRGAISRIASAACRSSRSAPCWARCRWSFYAVAPSIVFLWVAAALVGLANSAMEMGWPNMLADHTSLADRAKVAAGLNALTGARGLIAPFVGSLLVQAGILSVTAALLLCGAATAVGALLYLGMRPSGEPAGLVRARGHHRARGLRRARSRSWVPACAGLARLQGRTPRRYRGAPLSPAGAFTCPVRGQLRLRSWSRTGP